MKGMKLRVDRRKGGPSSRMGEAFRAASQGQAPAQPASGPRHLGSWRTQGAAQQTAGDNIVAASPASAVVPAARATVPPASHAGHADTAVPTAAGVVAANAANAANAASAVAASPAAAPLAAGPLAASSPAAGTLSAAAPNPSPAVPVYIGHAPGNPGSGSPHFAGQSLPPVPPPFYGYPPMGYPPGGYPVQSHYPQSASNAPQFPAMYGPVWPYPMQYPVPPMYPHANDAHGPTAPSRDGEEGTKPPHTSN